MDSRIPKTDNQDRVSFDGENLPRKRPRRHSLAALLRMLLSILLGITIFLPLLTAVGIFGYQVFTWAKRGTWIAFTFAKFAPLVGLPSASSLSPDSWLGIEKAVQTIFRLPATLVLFIFSVSVAIIGGTFQRR